MIVSRIRPAELTSLQLTKLALRQLHLRGAAKHKSDRDRLTRNSAVAIRRAKRMREQERKQGP